MANSNRFKITNSPWSVTADGTTIGGSTGAVEVGSTFDPGSDTWEPLSTFDAEISSHTSDGTWDLQGRGFIADSSGPYSGSAPLSFNSFPQDITIKNATFSGAIERTWTVESPGIYSTAMPTRFNSDSTIFDGALPIYDPAVKELPAPPLQSYQGTDLAGASGEYADHLATSPYSYAPSHDFFISMRNTVLRDGYDHPCSPIMEVNGIEVLAYMTFPGNWDWATQKPATAFEGQGVRLGNNLMVYEGGTWVDKGATASDTQAVTGFEVHSSDMKNYLDALVLANGSIENISLQMWGGPNVSQTKLFSSWDSVSGRLMLDSSGATFIGDMAGVFSAPSMLAAANDNTAVYAAGENKVYYKPPTGVDPEKAVVSYLGRIWDDETGTTTSSKIFFENCTFIGQLPTDPQSSGINWMDRNGYDGAGGLANCLFDTMDSASYRGQLVVTNTKFKNILNLCLNLTSGSTVQNNLFLNPQRYECMRVQKLQNENEHIELTTVEDNLFYMPYSTHGQGLSLYLDSWQKSNVIGNLFYNCVRALAFQPEQNSPMQEFGTMTFENNIVYWDRYNATGQWGLANQSGLPSSPLTEDQETVWRYNSFLLGESAFTMSKDNVKVWLPMMSKSDIYLEKNIGHILSASYSYNQNSGHYHKDNISYKGATDGTHGASQSVDDYGLQGEWHSIDFFKGPNTLELDPSFSGYGAQWSSYPAIDDILSLPTNWRDSYPKNTLPVFDSVAANSWGKATFNGDDRPVS